ncbi:5025_t:CDS:2, partial [Scutellospora calospora]
QQFTEFSPYRTEEGFEIPQLEVKVFVNVVTIEDIKVCYRRIQEKTVTKYMQLFYDGHSSATALHTYEDELHVSISSSKDLIKALADRSVNPDYDYVKNLFTRYRNSQL